MNELYSKVINRRIIRQRAGWRRVGGLRDSQHDVSLDVLDSWLALEELQKDIQINEVRSSDQENSTEIAVKATSHITAKQKADQLQWIQARWGTDDKSVVSGGWTATQSNKNHKNPHYIPTHLS